MKKGTKRAFYDGSGSHIIALPDKHIRPELVPRFREDPNVLAPYIELHDALYMKLCAVRDKLTRMGIDWCFINESTKVPGEEWRTGDYNVERAEQARDLNERRLKNNPTLKGPIKVTKSNTEQDHYTITDPGTFISMSLSSIRLVYNAQARFQADCLARNEEAKCRPGRTPEHTFGKEDDKRRGELAQKRGAQTLTHTQLSEYLDWYRAGIADDFRSRHEQILSQCTAPISIVTLGGGHFESLERKQSLAPSFESQAIANHRVSVYRLNQLPNLASGLDLTTCSTQELGSSLPSRVLSS